MPGPAPLIRLAARLLRRPARAEDEDPRPRPSALSRVVNRVAGVVFPTNKSGNNMSVR